MNRLENWFCATGLWSYLTRTRVLPWVLSTTELGDHLLEIGAGPGAATPELRRRVARVTSIEYSFDFAARVAHRNRARNGTVLQGDASSLPFAERTFSSAVAVLVLHHLRSPSLQNSAFAEIYRVLRPGGTFLALDIQDSWLNRVFHTKSTFVPLEPGSLPALLTGVGFDGVTVDLRGKMFRLRAQR